MDLDPSQRKRFRTGIVAAIVIGVILMIALGHLVGNWAEQSFDERLFGAAIVGAAALMLSRRLRALARIVQGAEHDGLRGDVERYRDREDVERHRDRGDVERHRDREDVERDRGDGS